MDEAKVRAAAKVANDAIKEVPPEIYREVWQSVFHALLSEPYGNTHTNRVEETNDESPTT